MTENNINNFRFDFTSDGESEGNELDVNDTKLCEDLESVLEYFTKKGVTIIEWADMIPDYLPEKRLDIRIKNSEEDENKRTITITPYGRKYEEICEAVL